MTTDPVRQADDDEAAPTSGCAAAATRPVPRPDREAQILTLLWAAAALLATAFGLTSGFGGILLFLFGVLLALAWCVVAFGRLVVEWGLPRLDWRSTLSWTFCPATVLLLGIFIYYSPWPLVLRVKLSEPALLRIVEEVRAGRTHFDPPARAGLFSIDCGSVRNGTVLLDTNEGWLLDTEGIAYVGDDPRWLEFGEDGSPPPPFRGRLAGRWCWFRYPD